MPMPWRCAVGSTSSSMPRTRLARALDVPYSILLVVGGSVIGFLPGVPSVELNPDLVLLLVLPPLLFHGVLRLPARSARHSAQRLRARAADHVGGCRRHARRRAGPAVGRSVRARRDRLTDPRLGRSARRRLAGRGALATAGLPRAW